jgi:hypothetical protein
VKGHVLVDKRHERCLVQVARRVVQAAASAHPVRVVRRIVLVDRRRG